MKSHLVFIFLAPILITVMATSQAQAQDGFLIENNAEIAINKFIKRQEKINKVPVWLTKVVLGDINGDGDEDAIIEYTVNLGYPGNLTSLYLAIFINERGKFVVKKKIDAGSFGTAMENEIEIESIKEGIITLKIYEFGPDDGPCCPSKERYENYKYIKGHNNLIKQF